MSKLPSHASEESINAGSEEDVDVDIVLVDDDVKDDDDDYTY